MPAELKELLEKYITASKFMKVGVCQGFDAILEELNKDSKSWLKMSGIPTEDQWLKVMRNLDDLTKVHFLFSMLFYGREIHIKGSFFLCVLTGFCFKFSFLNASVDYLLIICNYRLAFDLGQETLVREHDLYKYSSFLSFFR